MSGFEFEPYEQTLSKPRPVSRMVAIFSCMLKIELNGTLVFELCHENLVTYFILWCLVEVRWCGLAQKQNLVSFLKHFALGIEEIVF